MAALLAGLIAPGTSPAQTVVIDSVRLIDGTGRAPLTNAALVITGDRIVRVLARASPDQYPRGATVLHFPGRTVIPGLIDAHVHVGVVHGRIQGDGNDTRENVVSQLARFVRSGVTTVAVLGVSRDLLYDVRADAQAGRILSPTILTADRGIGVDGGGPPIATPPDEIDRPETPEAARAAVRAAAGRHADLIKLWVDDFYGTKPKMRPDLYLAIIDEAHRQHLRTAVHVFYLDDAKALVNAGVDILAHSVRDQPVDAEFIAAMKAHQTAYLATLTVDAGLVVYAQGTDWTRDPLFRLATDSGVADWLGSQAYADSMRALPKFPLFQHTFAMAQANVKALSDAGVRMGFGTDGGASPTRVQGFADHAELRMLVAAGLTPLQALTAATATNASILGLSSSVGTLEAGKRADLVVIDGDPLADIGATERIVAIWHAGRRVTPLVEAR